MGKKTSQPYFSSKKISSRQKEERLIQLSSALKEGISKATGKSINSTYAKGFQLLNAIAPEVYKDVELFFEQKKNLPQIVQEFINLDDPEKVIYEELEIKRKALRTAPKDKGQRATENRIEKLRQALKYFQSRKRDEVEKTVTLLEQDAIFRDFSIAQRDKKIYVPKPVERDRFREFSLPNGNMMRIRLLHNLPPERITGVDLVYEQVDLKAKKIRFALLQYKMWNERTFAINTRRELNQMQRMKKVFCNSSYCKSQPSGNIPYRLPFCSVFYRPTSKKQTKDARIMTSGIHIPVCSLSGFAKPSISMPREILYSQGLSNSTFDELFRNGLLGSSWMSISSVEKFYKDKKIMESDDSIVLNIREEFGHSNQEVEDTPRLRDLWR